MADTANTAYLKDKDNKIILPATDWSVINSKPNNLVTADQLPVMGDWVTEGFTFKNGAYSWDSQDGNNHNCAYRIVDFGSFKHVQLRLVFGVTADVDNSKMLEVINLPERIYPDGDLNQWQQTEHGVTRFSNTWLGVEAYKDDTIPARTMISFYIEYYTK